MNSSKVTITFEGLLLFCFKEGTCQVGINNQVGINANDNHHILTIKYRVGATSTWNILLEATPDRIVETSPLRLDVQDEKGMQVASQAEPHISKVKNDPCSFERELDLEGPEFYNQPLTTNGKKIPSLFITQGTFRSQSLVQEDKYYKTAYSEIISKIQQNFPGGLVSQELSLLFPISVIEKLTPFSRVIEASFELTENQKLVFKVGENGS